MNEAALILVVRVVAIAIIVLIIALVAFGIWRNRQRDLLESGHPRARRSALDSKEPLDPDSNDDFVNGNVELRQRTAQLNPSFFGDDSGAASVDTPRKKSKKSASVIPETKKANSAPSTVLPYTIMARYGRHLTGRDVANLVQTYGLQRAPSGAYELIGEDGEEVVFTMINVRKPGVFPEDLEKLDKLEGLMLIMQLPVGDDAVKSWETFTAMAHEMTETVDARLCDHSRRPIGDADLQRYCQAAEQFEREYQAWRQQQNL